jgi:glycosyltransferase involved in cell wall biosynthesis
MRILVVTPFMWSGAGKAVVRIASGLQSRGHGLHIVSSGQSKGLTDWPPYIEQLAELKIPYTSTDFFDRAPDVFWPSVERLERVVKVFEPDVIHAHSGVAAFGAIAASKVPVLATLHSWNPERPEWMNTMDLWALNQCDRVVCVSSSYRDYLLELGLRRETSETIYLGIDLEEIQAQAVMDVENPFASRRYLCYLGRLEPRKRQLLLVETLAALPEDWSLMLIGGEAEPGYAERVRQRAEELRVSDRLLCTGHVENPYALLRRAGCFVSASSDEGLGLSTLEAMALGVPVISTPARGIADFVRHEETGLLAQADPQALAEQIRTLPTRTGLALKLISKAAALVRSTFSWPLAVDQYAKRFEQLAESRLVSSR